MSHIIYHTKHYFYSPVFSLPTLHRFDVVGRMLLRKLLCQAFTYVRNSPSYSCTSKLRFVLSWFNGVEERINLLVVIFLFSMNLSNSANFSCGKVSSCISHGNFSIPLAIPMYKNFSVCSLFCFRVNVRKRNKITKNAVTRCSTQGHTVLARPRVFL